jgi:predicted transcriptional regulator
MSDKSVKMPCEKIVRYVLPGIRCEIARSMVDDHGLQQVRVARLLGLTEAAISQYLSQKRGYIEIKDDEVLEDIRIAAKRIMDGGEGIVEEEVCRICKLIRDRNLIPGIYETKMGLKTECVCD